MISRMKRIVLFISLIFVLALVPALPQTAAGAETAAERYAVAAEHDVWFYSEANEEKGLFIMPFSYYVKVLAEGEPFCRVEYLENRNGRIPLEGYCKKSDLQFVDFTPVRPWLFYDLELKYSIENGGSVGSGSFDTIARTVSFYGTYYSGTALYYYVYADGQFDYVPASQEIKYDFNTDYLTPSSGEVPPADRNGNGGLTGIQIAVVCIVCAAAVVVAFIVLRGKKPPVAQSPEEET